MNRDPINRDIDDFHCKALEAQQRKNKGKDTQKDSPIFITTAIVAVQWEDGGLWMHGVIGKPNNNDYRGCSYTVWVMKTGQHITSTSPT